MSQYIVSARKYRPDSFESLIGQENIARTLKNSISRGQLAHAYLFCGPRGVGKTSTARIFAKTINCSAPGPELEPCGECESCRSFAEGRSYCIHELDAASNNGVDSMKELMDQVQIPPQTGRYSVFIIDEVHMLTTSAFNAFLKTLEEPPAHAIFILATTEKHKILPTILSRCQTFDFNRISIPDIVRNLRDIAARESIGIDDESLHVIARKADGAMRDALTLFDQTVAFCGTEVHYGDVIRNLNVLDYEYSFRLVDAFLRGDYAEPMVIFDEILSKGFNALHFIGALSSHLRDLLVTGTGGLESLLDMPDSLKERYRGQASRCSVKFIYDALGISSQCEASYRSSANQRLHVEFALMRLAFLCGASTGAAASSEPLQRPEEVSARPAPVRTAPAGPDTVRTDSAAAEPVASEPRAAAKPVRAEIPSPVGDINASETPADPSPAEEDKSAGAQEASRLPSEGVPARRRAARAAAALSLSSLIEENEAETAKAATRRQAEAEESRLPDDEVLVQKWRTLVSETTQPRLQSALANASLEIREQDGCKTVAFSVANQAQKDWIDVNRLSSLETQYCRIAGCGKIRLETVYRPEEFVAKIYMPSEKAEDLIRKNEEFKNLVIDLELETK